MQRANGVAPGRGPVGKVIERKPQQRNGAIAVLDSSVGKISASSASVLAKPPASPVASPTSSLKIRSPPKPSILVRTKFVIKGKVQGVYFRKFTQQKAVELSIFGVVENHEDGNVVGEAEGRLDKMVEFKHWLETKGSPKSRIESASFVDESPCEGRKYSAFSILR